MAKTYTQPLWNTFITTTGVILGPVVPANTIWIVRDVTLTPYRVGSANRIGYGWLQEQAHGTTLWGVGYSDATGGRVYHQEIRQAVVAGNGLQFQCESPTWWVAVTGYVFPYP